MSAGPACAVRESDVAAPQIARSAVVVGRARLGEGALLAEGAVIRSHGAGAEVGAGSAVLENSVVVGNSVIPGTLGRRTVFGHRCLVVGATVGDLCEIGNASILMPGARLGDRIVRAGAVVKQRSHFLSRTDIDGFPASDRGHLAAAPERPTPAWGSEDLPVLTTNGPVR